MAGLLEEMAGGGGCLGTDRRVGEGLGGASDGHGEVGGALWSC